MTTNMTQAQVQEIMAEIQRLKAENERLAKGGAKTQGGLKVSEKGALSLYGLGRFPITLYKEQWIKLLDKAVEIRQFIAENDSKLAVKAPAEPK